MILVVTSVLIRFFKGAQSEKSRKFSIILQRRMPFGINSLIFQEVLQGAGSEKEYLTLKKYLETQRFYHLIPCACSLLSRLEPDDDDVLPVLFPQCFQLADERHADATADALLLSGYRCDIATSGTAWANFSSQPVTGDPTVYQIRQNGTSFGFEATTAFVKNSYLNTVTGGTVCTTTGPTTWTVCP